MEMKTQNQISHDMWFKEWGHSMASRYHDSKQCTANYFSIH